MHSRLFVHNLRLRLALLCYQVSLPVLHNHSCLKKSFITQTTIMPYNTIRVFPNLSKSYTDTPQSSLHSDHSSYFLHSPSFVRVPKEYSIACLQKDPSTRQANVLHMSMHSLLYSPRILQNVFDFTLSFHSTTTPVPIHTRHVD